MDFNNEVKDILLSNALFGDNIADRKKYIDLILRKVFTLGEKSGMKKMAESILREA